MSPHEEDLRFIPPFCPVSGCPSGHGRIPFRWRHRGRYWRACDGRWIPRFLCLVCKRSFSSQTFRSSYRYRKPFLHHQLLALLCSKVRRRQAARILQVTRKTVDLRFLRMSGIGRDFHFAQLRLCQESGGIQGTFQLDELETFEHHRKLKPVTMSVLIERRSYFVVHSRAGALPARRPLKKDELELLAAIEAKEGKRRSESRACVRASFEALHQILEPEAPVQLQTDKKQSYPVECRRATEGRSLIHQTTSSRAKRDYFNLLFPINHTLAMMRDGMSCLVRRSWGACKKRSRLQRHAWIWMTYRNYIRGVTVETKKTPAQSAGVCAERYSFQSAFQWRWPLRMLNSDHPRGPVSVGSY